MLQRLFDLRGHGTTVRTEVLAGLTTFVTMAYIVVVNPAILGAAGMPIAAVAVATCLASGLGSILMGLLSNYPLALAPGMGLNAYFTYTVVKGMGLPWQTALGCVFVSGVAFLVLTLAGVRQLIVSAVPRPLFAAVAGGIGLFIAFIGLADAGIVIPTAGTMVKLGSLTAPTAALAMLGLLVIAALQARRVRGAILLGILLTAAIAWLSGLSHFSPGAYSLSDLSAAAFKLDVRQALNFKGGIGLSLIEIVFVFLFVDMFDNIGTLVAVTKRAGLIAADGSIPRLNRILLSDSTAMLLGAVVGTSPVTSYIESAAGVAVGGRTGLTSVVVGILFLATLFFAPLVQAIPTAATAPALILVGALMMGALAEIDWSDPAEAIPAFLTVLIIPLTYSIANGLAFGITSHAILKLVRGEARPRDWLIYVLAAICIARFIYLA
ncbi:MAG TPA: NCS2 family permease [Steroidobacteraceae bacterium]|jgi:AGZA family xanthine/uracil permease-like MFS transporter|nr:NCS2 family permease [Steroidobacteraceae bacterium]